MGSSGIYFASQSSAESIIDPVDRDKSLDDDMRQNIHDPYSSLNLKWTPTTATIRSFCFNGTETLLMPVESNDPNNMVWPEDVNKLFLSDALMEHIVEETNRYAYKVLESQTVTRKSLLSKWVCTIYSEIIFL